MTARAPVTFVELEQDFCALRYGVGACRATKTNQAKADRHSVFSTDISESDNGGTGVYWRHTTDAEGYLTHEHFRPGFNIFANNPGDSRGEWRLPTSLFSDPVSDGHFLFYRLTIDSPQESEDVRQGTSFHRRFYLNFSEHNQFTHEVGEPTLDPDLYNVLFIALKNNETGDEAAAYFDTDSGDMVEPYRFVFQSAHPMSRLLDNVKRGDSITYVIGRTDRGDFSKASLKVDRGSNTYTQSATGAAECYNTFHTCQDPAKESFLNAPLTLRFAFPQAGKASDVLDAFPCLQSVSSVPTKINLAGLDRAVSPFGKRARVKITLQDFDYHDRLVDPYERTPAGGTFWSRWKARNKHYVNRPLRIYEGYAGQSKSQFTVRHYLVDRIDGPDNKGRVTITAKDILRIADDKSAVVPKPSRGRLDEEITETATSLTLSPSGIGREYGYGTTNAGAIRIGSEIMTFTRANGSDDLTVVRAQNNTEAKAHDAGEVVQFIKRYPASSQWYAHEVIYDLLTSEAGVDSSYIDRTDWWAEGGLWFQQHQLSTMLTKPEGITGLLGELAQMGVTLWWDERAGKIKLRAVRPELPEEIAEGYPHFSDDNALLDYPIIKESPEARLTRIFFYNHIISPVGNRTTNENYERLQIGVNLNAERAIEYGEERHVTIFNRWLDEQDAGLIDAILQRTLSYYEHAPIEVTVTVPVALADGAWTGDTVSLQSRSLPSVTGGAAVSLWQIISAEIKGNDRITFVLREHSFPNQNVLVYGGPDDTDADDPPEYTPTDPAPSGGIRYAYLVANNYPTYANATDEQKNEMRGGWIANDDGTMPDGEPGYRII